MRGHAALLALCLVGCSDPADVARGFGVRSTVVDSATGLRRAIEAAHAATGVTVIEARVLTLASRSPVCMRLAIPWRSQGRKV